MEVPVAGSPLLLETSHVGRVGFQAGSINDQDVLTPIPIKIEYSDAVAGGLENVVFLV